MQRQSYVGVLGLVSSERDAELLLNLKKNIVYPILQDMVRRNREDTGKGHRYQRQKNL